MSVLTIERRFSAAPETVFAYLTGNRNLLEWWGPEGMSLRAEHLDLSRPGPWSSSLVNAEGGIHKMSGEVIAVEPPKFVEFTWGWHNDRDERGHESVVRFEIEPADAGGTRFVLVHSGLPDEDSVTNHGKGWTSALRKLERLANP